MGTVILRIGIIILGVFLLSVTFSNYVRGKLREKATFLWGILAIAMICQVRCLYYQAGVKDSMM